MGLIKARRGAKRQHTPKVAFVAPPGLRVVQRQAGAAGDIDLLVRALSMGKLHHAMMGTASVAIATAAAIPGTLVNLAAGGGTRSRCASAIPPARCASAPRWRRWTASGYGDPAVMSRSARC
jgi:2-methylaconitate cis-trans-isomerase PrpF